MALKHLFPFYDAILKYDIQSGRFLNLLPRKPDKIGIELYTQKRDDYYLHQKDETVLQLTHKDGTVKPIKDISRRLAQGFRFRQISRRTSSDDYSDTSRDVFNAFVAPIADLIENDIEARNAHLLIVLPERLLSFPIHICSSPLPVAQNLRQAILFDFNVSYLPASHLSEFRVQPISRKRKPRKVVIVCSYLYVKAKDLSDDEFLPRGDFLEDLPGAIAETWIVYNFWKNQGANVVLLSDDSSFAKLERFARWKGGVFIQSLKRLGVSFESLKLLRSIAEQACLTRWLAEMRDADLFHYTGHTLSRGKKEGCGYLIIGNEAISGDFIKEHVNSFTNLSLVFLSSCVSSIGHLLDFASSPALAFLQTVPSVVATQWHISDIGPGLSVMKDFYHGCMAGNTLDEALGNAERKAYKSCSEKDYEPSGYILLGDYQNQFA